MPDWMGVVIALVYGLVIGSFLNVCIWRLPNDMSIVNPGSHCPSCKTPLKGRDLVPLFSFLLQRRKCRYCAEPISWRYFTIELITGVYFVLTYLFFAHRGAGGDADWLGFVVYALFGAALIAIFMIDLEHYIIPDQLNVFGIILGVGYDVARIVLRGRDWHSHVFGLKLPVPSSVVGIIVCGGAFLAVAIVSYYVFKKEGMGGGDIKLAAAVGALLGAKWAMISFFLAVVLGSVIGVALIASKKKGRRDYVPFGPFMVAGAVIVMFFQAQLAGIWDAYLRYVGIGG